MKETILILEDDPSLLRAIGGALKLEEYKILACATVKEARQMIWEQTPDLMVLDIILPDGSGVEFCREYRGDYGIGTPVLFLTALGAQTDILAGYEAGGADYLVKPFDLDILMLKIKSLLESRRAALAQVAVGLLTLDCLAGTARVEGEDLLLTPKEYRVLLYLARNRSRYVPAGELYEVAWGMKAAAESTVKHHIYHIREKLKERGAVDIVSSRGKGYRLVRRR